MTTVDPWRHVDADDDLVADLLAGSVEAVLEAGGWIHPAARIVVRAGQGHVVTMAELAPREPLLQVPSSCFVRIGRVTWLESDEALTFDGIPYEFGDAEAQLLILQTALHNACGKVPSLIATHPALAPGVADDVVQAVRAFRPSFRRTRPSVAGLFWSNRVFRVPPAAGALPEPCAIPLIDMLDHHGAGATGTWTGDGFAVTAFHPRGGGEVMLDYGLRRDAIGMAVVYGFADTSAVVAHSAPIVVDVPGVGQVSVEGRGRSADGALLAPVARRDDAGWLLSHVTFDATNPGSAIRATALAMGVGETDAAAVVDAIAKVNVVGARELGDAAACGSGAAHEVLRRAAERQMEVIGSAQRR